MEVKPTFFKIILLSFLSANLFAATLSVRPVTRADLGYKFIPWVTSSNPAVATATIIGKDVIPGAHTLSISSLAHAEQTASYLFHDKALGITETLIINSAQSQIVVEIATTDTLKDVASKINNAAKAANLNAIAYTITTQPNQYQLLIGSTQSGGNNAVYITESGTNGNTLGMSPITKASDATFILDGISFTSAGNNFILGEWLQVNLVSTGETTLTVNAT